MSRFRHLYRLFFVLFLVGATTLTALAQENQFPTEDVQVDRNPLVKDAEMYAKEHDVSLEEALQRLELQQPAGELQGQLKSNEKDVFAGFWIQHRPEFKFIVVLTEGNLSTVEPYVTNETIMSLIEVRHAPVTFETLISAQKAVTSEVRELGISVESGINQFENQVELYVTDRDLVNAAVQTGAIELPDYVEVVTVDQLSTDDADIYAGLGITSCTTGFSVKDVYSAYTGVTTAGHCGNSQTYNGSSLSFQGEALGGSFDVQWHITPSHLDQPWAKDSSQTYRVIVGTEHWNNQVLYQWVCKYGNSTGYGCGYIWDTTYQPEPAGGPFYNATFIRVHSTTGATLSTFGDSGGPWYSGSIAYGINKGSTGDDAIYMPINFAETGLAVDIRTG